MRHAARHSTLRRLSRLLLAGFVVLAACAENVVDAPVPGDDPDPVEPAYTNPVLDRDFPDPAVLRAPDGWYYAYGTETMIEAWPYNIQVARSRDLVTWTWEGDAFPAGADWARQGRSYWAPHVVYAPGQERYVMYYSAHQDVHGAKCLAVATAASPLGPFTDRGAPLLCGTGFVNIDPMAFDDPVSGRKLLYWGSGFEPIRVQELADDRMGFKPGTEPAPLVFPGRDRTYGNLVEGAWMVYRDGTYYLFYSGDNCCGTAAHYAVMVARATDPFGPFETLGAAVGTDESAILAANPVWNAPGHNAVVRDEAGDDWMFYHAIDRKQPFRNIGIPGVRWDRRVLMMDRIVYRDGWPQIEGGTPSRQSDARPVVTVP